MWIEMVGTNQKGDLSSVGDKGFWKALDCHIAIVDGESTAATAAGR